MSAIDDLQAAVANETTVDQSVETLLTQLTTLLQGAVNTGDMAKVQAAVDTMKANATALGQAITTNTPAAPVA